MAFKLGNNDVTFKVGSGDCTIYLGTTLLYSGDTPTPPTPTVDGYCGYDENGDLIVSATCQDIENNNWVIDTILATDGGLIVQNDIYSVALENCVFDIAQDAFLFWESLTSCTITNCTASIRESAFSNSGLMEITLGEGIVDIGEYAFYSCSYLTELTIPNSVTQIRNNAFENCGSIASCTIGDGISSIWDYAFSDCSSLNSITIEAYLPPTIGEGTFDNTNDCPIYVPSESVVDYQTEWPDYASRIQAIQE